MANTLINRLKHAWNIFTNRAPDDDFPMTGYSYSRGRSRPDRIRPRFSNERTIIESIYTKICVDAADIAIKHVRLDDSDRYQEDINSRFNECLNLSANVDQSGLAFRRDIYMSLLDQGLIAIVPTDTTSNLFLSNVYDILSMRVGKIVDFYPKAVKVNVYDENIGERRDINLPKDKVGIIENPFYSIMNEPNSTLQRLIRKLSILDSLDEKLGSGKLDLIIQLPYIIKSDARRQQAEQRRQDIEDQLKDSQYGIAYTDGTERIMQLNRPVENTLLAQVTYLTSLLYSQLGITEEILKGTADESTMLNYYSRTVMPLVDSVVCELKRTFLTRTARAQKQSVLAFQNMFKFVTVKDLAELADKFSRNEIMTANEIRQLAGLKPHTDPKADMLLNSNMPQPSQSDSTLLNLNGPTKQVGLTKIASNSSELQ